MKKKIIKAGIAVLLILFILFFYLKFFGAALSTSNGEYFYIKTGSDYSAVRNEIADKNILSSTTWFDWASKILGYNKIKPGRYKISKEMSVISFVRLLKNGTQSPVNFIITKLRTKEDLARKIGVSFECDSLQAINFMNNPDSLKAFDLDTNTIMSIAMPYSYPIKWNTTPKKVFQAFFTAYKTFWTKERKAKADSLHLTPIGVSIIASIIEEETNLKKDKYDIASVYLNRLAIGMPLQADPTIKFALKDFKLKRILKKDLVVSSPYNTYLIRGLPPGPICTPSVETIEAVLNAPKTEYLYFVASSNFDGSSIFSKTLSEHLKNARTYQQALNKLLSGNKQ